MKLVKPRWVDRLWYLSLLLAQMIPRVEGLALKFEFFIATIIAEMQGRNKGDTLIGRFCMICRAWGAAGDLCTAFSHWQKVPDQVICHAISLVFVVKSS